MNMVDAYILELFLLGKMSSNSESICVCYIYIYVYMLVHLVETHKPNKALTRNENGYEETRDPAIANIGFE